MSRQNKFQGLNFDVILKAQLERMKESGRSTQTVKENDKP